MSDKDLLYKVQTRTFKVGEQEVTVETGRLAKSASGAVLITVGESTILVPATGTGKPRPGIDFFPLVCDFEEKMY